MGNDSVVVKPYDIERPYEPQVSLEQLSLKDVDKKESVYSRLLVQLRDACLPDAVMYRVEPDRMYLGTVSWDLYLMLKHRQDWRPSGYGLGDLLYATSLLPNEELTLEIKTWETSKVQQDDAASIDEKNSSDVKTSSSAAGEVTQEQQTKTHEYVDAKASYGGCGFNASVAGGWSEDVAQGARSVAKHTLDRTQQTASEHKGSRQVKIAVSRELGSESRSTRKIKNTNQAYTLNVNYYELLREYEVQMTFYEAAMVVLGAEPDLSEVSLGAMAWKYDSWPEMPGAKFDNQSPPQFIPEPITLGRLIRSSQSSEWVNTFIDKHGVSPLKLLREMWAEPLFSAAMSQAEWTDPNAVILPEDREAFRSQMLQYVRPTAGWVEPDEKGALRWAYEALPDQEGSLLNFLYQFLPTSIQQVKARSLEAKTDPFVVNKAMAARFASAVVPGRLRGRLNTTPESAAPRSTELTALAAELKTSPAGKIMIPGPFHGMPVPDFRNFTVKWVSDMQAELGNLRNKIGPIEVDGQTTAKVVLPTQSVFADLALGLRSGAEDYYEIQRQFDLELKRMEIEKLNLEVQKLQLENQVLSQGKPASTVVIENPPDATAINLGINVNGGGAEVEFKKPT